MTIACDEGFEVGFEAHGWILIEEFGMIEASMSYGRGEAVGEAGEEEGMK